MTVPLNISQYDEFPVEPGTYVVYTDARIGELLWAPSSGPAYIGKADDGLRRRLEREHGGDTGRSTLRRTLGALLKEELSLSAVPRMSRGEPKPINFTNYDFDGDGNTRLSDWMTEHLTVICTPSSERAEGEKRLIRDMEPPLNLTGWANPYAAEIKAARKRCADEARSTHRRSG